MDASVAALRPSVDAVDVPGHLLGATAWERASAVVWLEARGVRVTSSGVAAHRVTAARAVADHLAAFDAGHDVDPRPPADTADTAAVARLRLAGWTFDAIADELGRSVCSVRRAWHRARQRPAGGWRGRWPTDLPDLEVLQGERRWPSA